MDFYDKIETKAAETKGGFYSYLKNNIKAKSDIISLKRANGEITTNKKEMAELFANYFSTVYKEPMMQTDPPEDSQHNGSEAGTLSQFTINVDLVLRELQKLPSKETQSHDGIPPIVFKRCAGVLAQPLTHLLNMSLIEGNIPEMWRHIIIYSTHKKGNKKIVTNYRPIGLTSIPSKICERIVRDQLLEFLHQQGLNSDKQHGFRNRRSTVTLLLTTQMEVVPKSM
jgi:hypothetical protein